MAETITSALMSGTEWKVKKAKTQKPGYEYEYYVTKNGSILSDPVYTESEARRIMDDDIQKEKQSGGNGGGHSLDGMFGGGMGMGEPQLPGFGLEGEDDDDDGPRLPFF